MARAIHKLIVMKFGGSSVEGISKLNRVCEVVAMRKSEGYNIIVVVSAMGNETDRLLELAHEITPCPDEREMDMLLTTGERISMSLLAMALKARGIKAISFTGSQSGIITDTVHSKARIVSIQPVRIENELEEGKVVIVAGFQGVSLQKEVTTLGRGGSDTTAVALASALGATRCEIFTDVPGIHEVDPRYFQNTRILPYIHYDEMIELAGCGCSVLETRAVIFARNFKIPLWVGSYSDMSSGSLIYEIEPDKSASVSSTLSESKPIIKGIAVNMDEFAATIKLKDSEIGDLADVTSQFVERHVPIEIVYQALPSSHDVNITYIVPRSDNEALRMKVNRMRNKHSTMRAIFWDSLSRISIVGRGIKGTPGITMRMMKAIVEKRIPIFLINSADIRVSAFIPRPMVKPTLLALADEFQLS